MSQLLPVMAEPAPITDDGFRALIDELPVGLVWVDEAGAVQTANEPAQVLLSSAAGPRLDQVISRLLEACRTTRTVIKTTLELSGNEKVNVSVAPDRQPGSFLVVLDRQRLEKARTEASVLRAVLKAISASSTRHQALNRALEAVHSALGVTHLAFFELDLLATSFSCVAASGLELGEVTQARALGNDQRSAALAATLHFNRVMTFPDVSRAELELPFSSEQGIAAVTVPVRGRSTRGVLYVSTREVLGDSLLRLCAALADAIGAVLDLATLEQEATRAREVASQRDRLATIGQLVAGVAHEINNPLAFLKSNLTSLRSDLHDPNMPLAEANDMVNESLEGVTRIENIVQALKGTARSRNEMVRYDPAKAISEAITVFRGAHKQDADIDCKQLGAIPDLIGSPSSLGQIALNLLQNGLDSMLDQPRQKRKLVVSTRVEEGRTVVSFTDRGTGIPPAVQERIYDAFFTTKEPGKGTGLGLAICREIADAMKAELTFTTSAEGTTFDLRLPPPQ